MRIKIEQCLSGNWVLLGHAAIKENQKPEEALDAITSILTDYENMVFNENKEGTSAFFFIPKQGPVRLEIVEE